MPRDDWHRNTEWAPETQEAFWSRWRRSRTGFHKAQYLKIQGSVLAGQRDPEIAAVGRELLRQVIRDFPQETMQVGGSWNALGSSLEKHQQFNEAVVAYHTCMDVFDRYTGNVDTGADVALAYLVAAEALWEHALLAKRYICSRLDKEGSNPFPLHWFRLFASSALIAAYEGDRQLAKSSAREAIEAAQIERTKLRYHSEFGVVDFSDPKTKRVVKRLFALV